VFHVLNRSAKRLPLFETAYDFAAFEALLFEGKIRCPIQLFSYCLMPNHWHLIICPRTERSVSQFMHWLTVTHAQRWHAFRGTAGTGSVYQGRFKGFPIQSDRHFLTACRYVERNPLRAGLVNNASDWRWSSLWRRSHGQDSDLDQWPTPRPGDWPEHVNHAQTDADLMGIREAIKRSAPFGDPEWRQKIARTLQLESSLRRRGRPKKEKDSRPLF
jgi:putative transposase